MRDHGASRSQRPLPQRAARELGLRSGSVPGAGPREQYSALSSPAASPRRSPRRVAGRSPRRGRSAGAGVRQHARPRAGRGRCCRPGFPAGRRPSVSASASVAASSSSAPRAPLAVGAGGRGARPTGSRSPRRPAPSSLARAHARLPRRRSAPLARSELQAVAADALAQAQVEDRRVVDRVGVEHQHRVGELEV